MALGMDVRVSTRDVQQFEGDALVVGVFADGKLDGPAALLDKALAGVIKGLQDDGEVRGAADEVTLLHTLGKIEPARVAIVGLGARDRYSLDRIRRASAIGCRTLRKAGAHHVGLALAWAEHGLNLAQAARASAEGAILGLYQFRRYKAKAADSDEAGRRERQAQGERERAPDRVDHHPRAWTGAGATGIRRARAHPRRSAEYRS